MNVVVISIGVIILVRTPSVHTLAAAVMDTDSAVMAETAMVSVLSCYSI